MTSFDWDCVPDIRDMLNYLNSQGKMTSRKIRMLSIACGGRKAITFTGLTRCLSGPTPEIVKGKRIGPFNDIETTLSYETFRMVSHVARIEHHHKVRKLIREMFSYEVIHFDVPNDTKLMAERVIKSGFVKLELQMLVDSLEESPIQYEEAIKHLREGEHQPGCWVLDGILKQ